jgi:putative spermidine/putrescine transport system substrate-binding protein
LGDATKAAAEKNPDMKFSIVDFAYDPTIPNVLGQVFSTDQAGFLAGYVAASVTKTGKIGTFGGIQIPSVTVFMDGYALGAKAYNEKHGTNVEVLGWDPVAQTGLFTGNFESTDDGRTMGQTLMDEGADIIMPVAGPVGLGTAAAAKERGNTYIIGVDADWYLTNPDYADIILTSVLKNMDITTVAAIKSVMDGTFKGGVTVGTLENGGVGLAPFHDLESVVPKDVVAELDAVKADIIAGKVATNPSAMPKPEATTPPAAPAVDLTQLIADAQAEGNLTTIALPHDWCNYGEVIDSFSKKYGIAVNELLPDGSSGDEVEAIKANKGNTGPQAPDVIDVGFSFGPQLISETLTLPYKVSTWDTIPDTAKDPNGAWYGDYYGAMGFEVNTDVVANPPKNWNDLLNPEYKGQVALAGDPRGSNQAIQAVQQMALANGGTWEDPSAGLDFFKKLNDAGNFVPVIAKQATIAKGETPIVFRWNYNALADRDSLAGNPNVTFYVPEGAAPIAGVYIQAISAYAPHPNAAKLWMEYLYSDEGQLLWMKGYCYPIRNDDLVKRAVVPAEIAAKLPPITGAVFPTLDQLTASKTYITTNWDKMVGADVK